MKIGGSSFLSSSNSNVQKKPSLALDVAFKKLRSGVEIYTEKYGQGKSLQKGDQVKVHYEGWLAKDHQLFDSSRQKKKAYEFTLGKGEVIRGWDQALEGVKIGSKIQLKIPAKLAYGATGVASLGIPPYADLIFKVEVLRK